MLGLQLMCIRSANQDCTRT